MFPEERATPLALLNYADFVGRDAVEQVDSARADWYCGCGCATVNLSVDPTAPSARKTYRPIPNEAMVVELNGENIGGIIVFADDGWRTSRPSGATSRSARFRRSTGLQLFKGR
jgi:hypothetical protein